MERPARRDVIVVEGGDIILALPQDQFLQVSSVVLSYASPVFKALFGPRFKESSQVRSDVQPKEVALPEDDPVIMTDLCHLLHSQKPSNHNERGVSSPQELYALAVAADKYDCVHTISLQTEAMLSRFLAFRGTVKLSFQQMAYLIAAAASLNHGRHYYLFTKRLILDYYELYSGLITDKTDEILSLETICK